MFSKEIVMQIIVFVSATIFGRFAFGGDKFQTGGSLGGPNERILHGSNAAEGQFPFMALTILARLDSEKTFLHTLCGGALISDCWVISAAHCINGSKPPVEISLGVISRVDLSGGMTFKIPSSGIFAHPKFRITDPTTPDVVLYKLPTPIKPNSHPNIKAIHVANLPKNSVTNFDDKKVIALGWGVTETGKSSKVLKYTTIKVFCHARSHMLYPEISKAFICTEKFTKYSGPCSGDSGGPLITKGNNGAYELIGITSHTKSEEPCFDPFSVDVYTYVPYHLDWIHNIMSSH